jgi:hypothetical protein
MVLTLAVVVLVVGAVAVYLFVTRDTTESTATPTSNAAEDFEGGETELVYVDFAEGSDLHRLDLADDADEIVGELPQSGDTQAAPGSTWLSIQGVEEDGDKFIPALFLYDTDAEEEIDLGLGFEPMWSADGSQLAFIAPDDPSRCGEEECRGPRKVMVVDVAGGEPEALTESGAYNMLGWAGDHVVVQNEEIPGSPVAQTVSPAGQVEDLPMLPREFWGASPDGRWMIQTGESGTRFLEMAGGRVDAEGADIAIPEGTILGSGGWAHDSSRVAAAALDENGDLQLMTFSPSDPEPTAIDSAGESSVVNVMWSPENDELVFQRLTGEEFEAVHCPLDESGECEVLFAWTRGISMLRIE